MHFWLQFQHAKNWKPSCLSLQKEKADKTENKLLYWIHWRIKFMSKRSIYLKEKMLEPSLR